MQRSLRARMARSDAILSDTHPDAGMHQVSAIEMLARKLPELHPNRVLSQHRISQIVEEQHRADGLIFADPLIVVHTRGGHYLVDGAHRLMAIHTLGEMGHPDVLTLELMVMVYVCDTPEMAERIYATTNSVPLQILSLDQVNSDAMTEMRLKTVQCQRVAKRIAKLYSGQVGSASPRFDPECLAAELEKTQLLLLRSVKEVVRILQYENAEYGKLLQTEDPKKYQRCRDGFYLACISPKCRWVLPLVAAYV